MKSSSFNAPVGNRYFEDYVAGSVHEFGPIAVERDEVVMSLKMVNFVRSRNAVEKK